MAASMTIGGSRAMAASLCILAGLVASGCDGQGGTGKPPAPPPAPSAGEKPPPKPPEAPKAEEVTISGRAFKLEPALADQTRFRGLSGRTEIAEDGGMLFVFPKPQELAFVMRDCPIPIDIIYLDGAGRVVSSYAMTPEPPRSPDEAINKPPYANAPSWAWYNQAYEDRLKKYPSRFDAQFVIELKGGTLEKLPVKAGEKVDLDVARLKRLAK